MKFFAALLAKLTGTAEAPRTLEQARATHAEAKSALDQIAAMFAAASLDFDALLAAGSGSLKAHLDGLQAKLDEQTALVASSAEKLAAHTAALDEAKAATKTAQDQLATASAALTAFCAAVGLKPADLAAMTPADAEKALQEAHAKHVSSGVAQRLGELGVPASSLPAPQGAGAADRADLWKQFNAITDPAARGAFYKANFTALFGVKSNPSSN